MSKTILVLGASFAGLTVAHTLLKKTFVTVKDYKVVLISPTDELYYNTASVRAIVPGQFTDEKIFQEIAPGFANYPSESFEFVLGTASSLDPTSKTVTYTPAVGPPQSISYEILVVATGARTIGEIPWKNSPNGSAATKVSLHKVQEQVKNAQTIVIGGGGPTGVETAGELGFEYKDSKEVTLITSGEELLIGSMPTNLARGAEAELLKLQVKIVKNTKVESSNPTQDGKTELVLSNGEKKIVDLYLPTIGVLPNSDFIPKNLLNPAGDVIVDDFLRVKNATDIWACGDIIDLEPSQIIYAEKQAAQCAKNLDLVLKGKEPTKYAYGGGRIMGLTLGRSKATGRFGNNKVPSLVIWWVKGRTLGTENLPKYVSGSKF